jgi:hypothetical protein
MGVALIMSMWGSRWWVPVVLLFFVFWLFAFGSLGVGSASGAGADVAPRFAFDVATSAPAPLAELFVFEVVCSG